MGYRTRYDLGVYQGDKTIIDVLAIAQDFNGLDYAIDYDGKSTKEVKWYNHENDLKKLSKDFPDLVFVLRGEGEDSADVWKKYFKNGRMQVCVAELVIPPFDESKLK